MTGDLNLIDYFSVKLFTVSHAQYGLGISSKEIPMKLLADGQKVIWLERGLFDKGSHILRIIIFPNTDPTLHRHLVALLKQGRDNVGGVMDVEAFASHEERPNQSEIRVLEGLELEVIDLVRLSGYIVIQTE